MSWLPFRLLAFVAVIVARADKQQMNMSARAQLAIHPVLVGTLDGAPGKRV